MSFSHCFTLYNYDILCITINFLIKMSTIAFRSNETLKKQLENLAQHKGINLSALIKLYLTKAIRKDLNEKTVNGMTVAEELELLAMKEEGSDGKMHNSVDELMSDLDD